MSTPHPPLSPTRTMATEFDDRTELVLRDPEDEEHTLRGELIPEPEPELASEPHPEAELDGLTRVPPPPAVARRRRWPAAMLVFAAVGGVIGVLSAFVLR